MRRHVRRHVYSRVYRHVCRRVCRDHGFEVCGFSGGSNVSKRHKTIRAFQESAEASVASGAKKAKLGAKVFVATIKVRVHQSVSQFYSI